MKHCNSHRWYLVESDTALPGLVCEKRVQLGNVHYNSVPLAQMDVFQVVLVTLVLGKIYKHLEKEGEEEEKQMRLCLN